MLEIKTKSFSLAIYARGNPSSVKLALVLPGKLDTKDYPHMRSHVEYLAKKGYFAVSFDPPGTWESSGGIELYTMTNYLKAIDELIEYFGNKPTFVIGHSRGGSMAMLAGTKNEHIARFGSIMSHYSFKPEIHGEFPDDEWQKNGYRISKRDEPDLSNKTKRQFIVPYKFLEDQITYDGTEALKQSTKPKMFVMGKRDVLVPPAIVESAYALAAEPKVLYSLDSGHDYRCNPELIETVNEYIGAFLAI